MLKLDLNGYSDLHRGIVLDIFPEIESLAYHLPYNLSDVENHYSDCCYEIEQELSKLACLSVGVDTIPNATQRDLLNEAIARIDWESIAEQILSYAYPGAA